MSQSVMATHLGLHCRQAVYIWESNPSNMKVSQLEDYAAACGVRLADLLGYDGEAQNKLDKIKDVLK